MCTRYIVMLIHRSITVSAEAVRWLVAGLALAWRVVGGASPLPVADPRWRMERSIVEIEGSRYRDPTSHPQPPCDSWHSQIFFCSSGNPVTFEVTSYFASTSCARLQIAVSAASAWFSAVLYFGSMHGNCYHSGYLGHLRGSASVCVGLLDSLCYTPPRVSHPRLSATPWTCLRVQHWQQSHQEPESWRGCDSLPPANHPP
jgi:hypothetical protein